MPADKSLVENNVFIGTSGIALPVANKESYPAEFRNHSRLSFYSSLFNTIEINSTFRKLPQLKTLERWTTEVSEPFRFTFKVPETITHKPGLQFDKSDLKSFLTLVNSIPQQMKGCLLFQFPGKIDAAHHRQLEKLLKLSNKESSWQKACEFRHASWYTDETASMLNQLNTVNVIHDFPSLKIAQQPVQPKTIYLRFHGPDKGYRGSYESSFLEQHAQQIREWAANGREAYVYFNNTLGAAAKNAISLRQSVERS